MTRTRRVIQGSFLALVLCGVFWAGANCERWCPFGGVEALYTYAAEGNLVCSLGTSNFFILAGVLGSALLLRRAFCGYACPIGTLSEWCFSLGRWFRLPAPNVPERADRGLGLLKYAVLAAILVLTWRTGELIFRGFDPCYALLSRHGADITGWAYVVSGVILVGSLLIRVPFCRWLCPFAAVLNPFSRFAVGRIRRNPTTCRECGNCARRCPMAIPVDRLEQVTVARCTSCLSCVEACRVARGREPALLWGFPRPLGRRWSQAVLLTVLFLCLAVAVMGSYAFPLPAFVKSRGVLPSSVAEVTLQIGQLTCRGRANLLYYFLDRDDLYALPGYFRIEAWPDPAIARVRITYDAGLTTEQAIQQAITEPYFDAVANQWRNSPFVIEGYDPFDLGGLLAPAAALPDSPPGAPK